MDYQIGKPGRTILVLFRDGDDVLEGLVDIARRENIRAASFALVGGLKKGRFVVGPETEEMPPRPLWRALNESHETLGFGTVFWQGETPRVHFHGAYGKRDDVQAGCLREGSEAFLVVEAVIWEILDVVAVREVDPASGMALLKLRD